MIGRRKLLTSLAAAAAVQVIPARARPGSDAELREVLDGLNKTAGYDARLAQLQPFTVTSLSRSASLDLRTIRRALAIDSQLARLIPGGKSEGPYRLPPAAQPGLWRQTNGTQAFALLLERHVGDRVDPEAAHRRFERTIARLVDRAID